MDFLIQFCLRGGGPDHPETRHRCGTIAGSIGIAANALLFFGKFLAGLFTGSVAMVADAVNNLSDAATSAVTLVGFHLAGQQADAEHPFGHGRIEYITGLIVSLAILLMGFEVGCTAAKALFQPAEARFSPVALVILILSILVKLGLFAFYRALGRAIDSGAMAAAATDSLSDAASSCAVLVSMTVSPATNLPLDALAGLAVAVLVLKAGWRSARDTLDPLLGRPMDPALAADIDRLVVGHDKILGIHDLVYHDYGPGRAMMTLHAEVPADGDFLELHDIIDHIERELKAKHHVETVIHMDPVVSDERTDALRAQIAELVVRIDPRLTIHDFRMTPGPNHTNLIFDLVVPYGFSTPDDEVCSVLIARIKSLSERFFPVIQVEHSYVDTRNGG